MSTSKQIEKASQEISNITSDVAEKINETTLDGADKTGLLFSVQLANQKLLLLSMGQIDTNNTLTLRILESKLTDKSEARRLILLAMVGVFDIAAVVAAFMDPANCTHLASIAGIVTAFSILSEPLVKFLGLKQR